MRVGRIEAQYRVDMDGVWIWRGKKEVNEYNSQIFFSQNKIKRNLSGANEEMRAVR